MGGSYTTDLPGKLQLGTAFNLGSGDHDPTDGVHGTFDQLYPLGCGHGLLRAAEPLVPRCASLCRTSPWSRCGVDAWYNVGRVVAHLAADAAISSHVGNELDITLRLPVGPVGLEVGYGRFFGGAYLQDADFTLDTADLFYVQTMVGF